MMSVAEVISMAMAELLVVMLKVRGRHGRTYDDPKTIYKKIFVVGFSARLFFMDIVGGVHTNGKSSRW
jgi:hypothetical protein